MIYLIVFASLLTAFAFYRRSRRFGVIPTLADLLASALLGWISGLLIGAGARIGMWAIPFFNGTEPRITFDGTLQVVLTFSLFGIGLAIIYEFFFRRLLREHGLLFGLLISLIVWYPLGSQGIQQLRFSPTFLSAALVTFAIMAITFIPFSVVLEYLLGHWHHFRSECRSPHVSEGDIGTLDQSTGVRS